MRWWWTTANKRIKPTFISDYLSYFDSCQVRLHANQRSPSLHLVFISYICGLSSVLLHLVVNQFLTSEMFVCYCGNLLKCNMLCKLDCEKSVIKSAKGNIYMT